MSDLTRSSSQADAVAKVQRDLAARREPLEHLRAGLEARMSAPVPDPALLPDDATPAQRSAHAIETARAETARREQESWRQRQGGRPLAYEDLPAGHSGVVDIARGLAARFASMAAAAAPPPTTPPVVPPPPVEERPVISEATWEANRRVGLGPR
jgi:hypothetical protein